MTVRPKVNLILDIALFALFILVMMSAMISHEGQHANSTHYLMWHRVHGVTGGLFGITLTVHLLFHFPWVKAQYKRLTGRSLRSA